VNSPDINMRTLGAEPREDKGETMTQTFASDSYSLLADIGGTNTRVALSDGAQIIEATVKRFRNAEFSGLDAVLEKYLADAGGVDCLGACVAVAGPVADHVATLTNLDWTIDRDLVARATGAEVVSILNDLQAQGHALGHLQSQALRPMLPGHTATQDSAKLVVGIGTGFNAAVVHETSAGRLVTASESGHMSLPARNEADLRLSLDVAKVHGFAGVEDALSGRGLERIYAHHAPDNKEQSPINAATIMASVADSSDPTAAQTVETFCRLLGTVVGDFALVHLPFGGIYLVGGVARAMAPYLMTHGFDAAFRDKGRFASFVDAFPVTVIEDDYAALIGCAHHLTDLMK
jgi:glucokinase